MGEHSVVTQPTAAPTAKVLAAWLTGGGATLVLAVLAFITDSVDQGTFWGGLAAAVLTGGAAYLKKSNRSDVGA